MVQVLDHRFSSPETSIYIVQTLDSTTSRRALSEIQTPILDLRLLVGAITFQSLTHNSPRKENAFGTINVFVDGGIVVVGLAPMG
jgi:hypothetical protein